MPSMKRLPAATVALLLTVAGLPAQPARADANVGCGQKDSRGGSCDITVRVPGSGGQPGKPPAQPRGKPTGDGGGGGQERPHWPVEGCLQYDPSTGVCVRFTPSDPSPAPAPQEAPEPAVLARIAIGRMDLKAPEIGMWPSPLEQLPEGRNYVGWNNWMWVNNPGRNTWGPITKTVTESGYSVTATAMVAGVTWEMGNGDTKECGKGTEHPEYRTHDEKSPDCGYVYHQRGDFTVTATAHWVINWRGLGKNGTIQMDLTSQVHTSVVEVVAVNIPNGKYNRSYPTPAPSPNPTGTPTALAPCPTNNNKHGC